VTPPVDKIAAAWISPGQVVRLRRVEGEGLVPTFRKTGIERGVVERVEIEVVRQLARTVLIVRTTKGLERVAPVPGQTKFMLWDGASGLRQGSRQT
jgi:hypothetical protein